MGANRYNIAGTGKSTLVSSIVHELESEPHLSSTQAFAYFYCSRTSGHGERQESTSILSSLLVQLSCPLRGLPIKPTIVNKYNAEKSLGSKRASLSMKECQNLIAEVLAKHYELVTIVIDALDEIDSRNRGDLLAFLQSLVNPQKAVVKLFVSSRNEPDLFDYLGRSENVLINATDNAADIELYFDEQIEHQLLRGKASRELKDRVKKTLTSKAQGMFVALP